MLKPVKNKQPLRTVGELKAFIQSIPDETLLASFSQYDDEITFPMVAEVITEPEDVDGQEEWWNHSHLILSGYEQYEGDPNLLDSWQAVLESEEKYNPDDHIVS